jgi:large subunit ribosomal protein L15
VRAGLVKGRRDCVKLLGQGEIAIPLTVKTDLISQSARRKIESAGGTVEVSQL